MWGKSDHSLLCEGSCSPGVHTASVGQSRAQHWNVAEGQVRVRARIRVRVSSGAPLEVRTVKNLPAM